MPPACQRWGTEGCPCHAHGLTEQLRLVRSVVELPDVGTPVRVPAGHHALGGTWVCLTEVLHPCSLPPCAPLPPLRLGARASTCTELLRAEAGGGPPAVPHPDGTPPSSPLCGGADGGLGGLGAALRHQSPAQPPSGGLFLWGGGPANEGRACHVGLTAGEGVAGDNVGLRQPLLRATGLRPPACRTPAYPSQATSPGPHHVLQEEAGAHENPFHLKKEPGGKPQPTALGGE